MPTIPASAIVQVVPGVTAAGGSAVALSGLMLTSGTRVPIGTVLTLASAAAASAYFGASSAEAIAAADYFSGYDNSSQKPGALLFAQYAASAVPAYLRGGSLATMTLAQLQALGSGTVIVTINGSAKTSGTINLAATSSFSNAASLIQAGLAASDASVTGAIAPNVVTGSIATTVLTVSAVTTGLLAAGQTISGSGVTAGTTIVTQLTGTAGGTGTYTVSASQTVSSTAITGSGGGLTVSAVASGTLAVGQIISGSGITVGTTITALGTGVGGTGTYAVSVSQTASSTAITAGAATVTYDSVASAFVITGGTPGAVSTIGFATGTLSTGLKLTSATGAVTSQGSAASVPGTFMAAIANQTTAWATFMTLFDPDATGNANKLLFATWAGSTSNRYAYVCWDTDSSPTTSSNAASSLGRLISAASLSGTFLIYAPDYNLAAFACGAVASINFSTKNGRATLAFKSQSGMVASVTDPTVASNLAANGYNFYGAYATATEAFTFLYPGSVSGSFAWMDSFVNQIWLNSYFQNSLMTLLTQAGAVPYNAAGYSQLRAACMDAINAGLNFGAFRGGVPLSASQIAAVNTAAGATIDGVLATQGWHLQILPASAQVRAARGTPPMTFWYMDGGAVQSLSLASILVQ